MSVGRAMMMEAFRVLKEPVRYPVYGSCPDKRWISGRPNIQFGFMAFTDQSLVCVRLNRYVTSMIDEVLEIPLPELEILRMKKGWIMRHILIRDRRTAKKMELGFCKKVLHGDFTEQTENSEMFWQHCAALFHYNKPKPANHKKNRRNKL